MVGEGYRLDDLERLIGTSIGLGATKARSIDAGLIVVDDRFASMCVDPQCVNYGLSASCPPHVSGPTGFRELLASFHKAIVVVFDVPTVVLLSDERREVFRLLHETVATVELQAIEMGYSASRAFAGGGCKALFCPDEPDCSSVKRGGICRHPNMARPSMSGYGVDVKGLMATAGWTMQQVTAETDPELEPTSPLIGLVLVG